MTTEEFIAKANEIHKNKYDYSKVHYENNHTKVCIICPTHGEFWQTPNSHLMGVGCPSYYGNKKLTQEVFEQRANKIHNNKYDYSKSVVNGNRSKIIITCPIHGDFEQTVKNHLNGQGCPHCGKIKCKEHYKQNFHNFIEESQKRFGDRYDFPNIENEYVNSHSKITIQCKKCGNIFTKIACDHITSPHGECMHCYFTKSKPEEELGEFIQQILPNDEIRFGDRTLLHGYELDIYIPSKQIAIEFNGLYWHNSSRKDKYYHLNKTKQCEAKEVHLIQIFEDEYIEHKEIVLSKIKSILGLNNNTKIGARKCIVKTIDYKTASIFLDKNHIQGCVKSTVYLGLFYNEQLISVICFKQEKDNCWELTRFATDINIQCQGGCSKVLSYFIKQYHPLLIKSFADRRWSTNIYPNMYDKLGFKLDKILAPDYSYVINGSLKRFHKFNFRKKILHQKYNLDINLTESEMTQIIHAYRIYNCGLLKYILTF